MKTNHSIINKLLLFTWIPLLFFSIKVMHLNSIDPVSEDHIWLFISIFITIVFGIAGILISLIPAMNGNFYKTLDEIDDLQIKADKRFAKANITLDTTRKLALQKLGYDKKSFIEEYNKEAKKHNAYSLYGDDLLEKEN